MSKLMVGYTELGGGKLKKGKGFSKPNFGLVPSWQGEIIPVLPIHQARDRVK